MSVLDENKTTSVTSIVRKTILTKLDFIFIALDRKLSGLKYQRI